MKILTEREKNVLQYLTYGYTNEKIASELDISIHTVKAHLEAIYEKLDVSNRVQATIKSIDLGIIEIKDRV